MRSVVQSFACAVPANASAATAIAIDLMNFMLSGPDDLEVVWMPTELSGSPWKIFPIKYGRYATVIGKPEMKSRARAGFRFGKLVRRVDVSEGIETRLRQSKLHYGEATG